MAIQNTILSVTLLLAAAVSAQRVPEGRTYIRVQKPMECGSTNCVSQAQTATFGKAATCNNKWCPAAVCGEWAGMKDYCCNVYKHSTEKGRGAAGPFDCDDVKEFVETVTEKDGIAATGEFCKQGGWPLFTEREITTCCPQNYDAIVVKTDDKTYYERCISSTDPAKKNKNPEPVLTGTPITSGIAEATGSSSSGSSSGSGSGSGSDSGSSGSGTSTGSAAQSSTTGSDALAMKAGSAFAALGLSVIAAVGWLL